MTDTAADDVRQAFSDVVQHDDLQTRRRSFDALLATRLYLTHRSEPRLTLTAYPQPDGSLMIPASTDEIALRKWIRKDTPFGNMPAKTFFRAAVKMGIDDVVIDPGGWAFRIGRDSMILLGQGINPGAVPQGSQGRSS